MELYLRNKYSYDEGEEREIATEAFDLGEKPTIFRVLKGSPAYDAGLEVGDEILSINGQEIPSGQLTSEEFKKTLGPIEEGKPIAIKVIRNEEIIDTKIIPEKICLSPVALVRDDSVNAFADGARVYISHGMIRFVENDQELALVISHEIAHNIMEHMDAKTKNALLGGGVGLIFDIAAAFLGVNTQGAFSSMGVKAGGEKYSQEFEKEADYVALYLMALSGYSIDNAADFWRRMAALHPGGIEPSLRGSHPSSAERYVAIENIIKEIKQKIKENDLLKPEMKETATD